MSDRDDGRGADQALEQLVEDRAEHDDARRGRALLAGIREGAR